MIYFTFLLLISKSISSVVYTPLIQENAYTDCSSVSGTTPSNLFEFIDKSTNLIVNVPGINLSNCN
jgi:hypothetical protein